MFIKLLEWAMFILAMILSFYLLPNHVDGRSFMAGFFGCFGVVFFWVALMVDRSNSNDKD